MIWLFFALFAAALVAFLLVALRRYERESAATARREVEALRQELDRVVARVETLEAIATAEAPSTADVRPDLSEAEAPFRGDASLSSADAPRRTSRPTRQGSS